LKEIGLTDRGGETRLAVRGDAIFWDLAVEFFEGDSKLKAGKVGAEAEVIPASKRNMATEIAGEIDTGVAEFVLVNVCRSTDQHDLLAGCQGNPSDLDCHFDGAGDDHDRRLPTKELFYGRRDERFVVDELCSSREDSPSPSSRRGAGFPVGLSVSG
jgi:hypothetical protein